MRMDAIGKQVLGALLDDPLADAPKIARDVGANVAVVEDRLGKLREAGVLQGHAVRLDPTKLGYPHELMVTGTPSDTTTTAALAELCGHAGVSRVWTMASRNAVAFTLCGQDPQELEAAAGRAAQQAGLLSVETTLIVNTLFDDPGRALRRMMQRT